MSGSVRLRSRTRGAQGDGDDLAADSLAPHFDPLITLQDGMILKQLIQQRWRLSMNDSMDGRATYHDQEYEKPP